MNELINQITQRVGISQQQAQQTVQVVIGFLKQKLPGPMASQLDNFVSQQGTPGGQQSMGGQPHQDIGGMFGGDRP
ncbi:MAG TPA: hypothetical protein VH599_14145 [Ktedonobacterales bacterium]